MLVLAPAKVNLTLDVLGRRADGYHDIRSVVQTVNLFDEVAVETAGRLEVASPIRPRSSDLVVRAAEAFYEKLGKAPKVRVSVTKKIPIGAGLGGGSSDAAATLRLLNAWEGMPFRPEELLDVASTLGSDVPFLLVGGTALIEGRGEVVRPLAALPGTTLVLFVPPYRLATGDVYRAYRGTSGGHTERFLRALSEGQERWPLGNDLTEAAFAVEPRLGDLHRRLAALGAEGLTLTGSGSALFAPAGRDVSAWVRFAEGEGVDVFLVSFLKSLPPVGRWIGEARRSER